MLWFLAKDSYINGYRNGYRNGYTIEIGHLVVIGASLVLVA